MARGSVALLTMVRAASRPLVISFQSLVHWRSKQAVELYNALVIFAETGS